MIKKIVTSLLPLLIYLILLSTNNGEIVILLGGLVFIFFPFILKKLNIKTFYPILYVFCFHLVVLIIGVYFKGYSNTNFIGNFYILYLLFSYLLGGYIFNRNVKRKVKYIYFFTFLFISFVLSHSMPTIIENKLFFNTYTGSIDELKINLKEIEIYDFDKNNYINLTEFNDEYIIIDFWNNNCGVCIEKFKYLDELIQNQKFNLNKSKIISINIYKNKEDIKKGNLIFKKQKLNFENYFADKKYEEVFEINGYPTVIVIKNKKIIFKGTIETLNLFKYLYL